jgi:zinc metalloprotease ZmpB
VTGRRLTLIVVTAVLALAATAGAAKPPGPTSGTGLVFWTNPVQDLEDESLTDQKDARAAVPSSAYHQVQLTNLEGSGFLRGPYVNVRNDTGPSAYSTTGDYRYFRDQGQFEQVMAFYWITEAQKYLQSLGFTGSRAILDEGIDVRINQWGQDNSFFWDKHHVLRFGKGDVDDAEDAEVILHEYGHAIQGDQVPGFGPNPDGGAIGEAFGDYFAVSFGNAHTGNTFEPACVADWDSTGYTAGPIHACAART